MSLQSFLSFVDKRPRLSSALSGIPCPAWLAGEIAAHERRRALVLEIWALSGRPTAFLALWLARAASIRGGTVEGSLRFMRESLVR